MDYKDKFYVGITYAPEALDERIFFNGAPEGFKDQNIWRKIRDSSTEHKGGSAFLTNMNADDSFEFDSLEDALGFMSDNVEKDYVTSQVLVKGERYEKYPLVKAYYH